MIYLWHIAQNAFKRVVRNFHAIIISYLPSIFQFLISCLNSGNSKSSKWTTKSLEIRWLKGFETFEFFIENHWKKHNDIFLSDLLHLSKSAYCQLLIPSISRQPLLAFDILEILNNRIGLNPSSLSSTPSDIGHEDLWMSFLRSVLLPLKQCYRSWKANSEFLGLVRRIIFKATPKFGAVEVRPQNKRLLSNFFGDQD